MELNLENKTYEESIELLKQIIHDHSSLEIYSTAPITKDIFKKPGLKFTVNIIYNKIEDKSIAFKVDFLLSYILIDYFARDEDNMDDEDYCSDVYIRIGSGTDISAKFRRNDIKTPYTLCKDGVYYE